MSNLSTAMMSALSGLRASQAGLAVVANNVANAGFGELHAQDPSNRRECRRRQRHRRQDGRRHAHARPADPAADVDRERRRLLHGDEERVSRPARHAVRHSRATARSLDGIFNTFTQSPCRRWRPARTMRPRGAEVLNTAQVLAQQLNGMSTDVQSLRSQTELALATSVDDANDALTNIARISAQIEKSAGNGPTPPALLDERDGYISKLASLMDIKVVPQRRRQDLDLHQFGRPAVRRRSRRGSTSTAEANSAPIGSIRPIRRSARSVPSR